MQKVFKHLKIYTLENDILRFEYSPQDHFVIQDTLYIASKKLSDEELEFKGNGNISFEYRGLIFSFDEENPLETLVAFKDEKHR